MSTRLSSTAVASTEAPFVTIDRSYVRMRMYRLHECIHGHCWMSIAAHVSSARHQNECLTSLSVASEQCTTSCNSLAASCPYVAMLYHAPSKPSGQVLHRFALRCSRVSYIGSQLHSWLMTVRTPHHNATACACFPCTETKICDPLRTSLGSEVPPKLASNCSCRVVTSAW